MSEICEKAYEELKKAVAKNNSGKIEIENHINEMLKWVDFLLEEYPNIDCEVVKIAVYLHDIGHFLPGEEDHAVLSENFAAGFLEKNNYPKTKEALHCVRAHRNRDVIPKTLEAKAVTVADSLSHISNGVYWVMIKEGQALEKVVGKIKRDYRDLSFFPKIQTKMENICVAWEKIVVEYQKIL